MMRFLCLYLIFFVSNIQARLEFEDGSTPELVTSSRALAMGNSYASKVDDSWSAFYNPAGLGTVRKARFHLANIHLETNNGFLDASSGAGAVTDAFTKYSDAFKADGIRSLLRDTPGMSHARLNLFPNFTFRGLSIGYMYSQQQRARLECASCQFDISERIDMGPVASLSLSFWGGIFKIGGSVVALTRKQMQKEFAQNESTDIGGSDYTTGTMTNITVGTRLTLPVFMIPTFSFVFRNASASEWYGIQDGGAPPEVPQTSDFSFSITPILSGRFRMHAEIGMKDITDQYSDTATGRKLVGGLEFDFNRRMFVRFGYGDGWGSGGIGVRSKKLMFDLTTYAIEADSSKDSFREEEDRRYALSLSMGF